MNATVQDLLQTIGELTMEGRLLRRQVGDLSSDKIELLKTTDELIGDIEKLKETKKDKKEG